MVHLRVELNHADIRAYRASGPRHVSSLALAFEFWNYEWRNKIVLAFIALLGFGLSALADDASVPARAVNARKPAAPAAPRKLPGEGIGAARIGNQGPA